MPRILYSATLVTSLIIIMLLLVEPSAAVRNLRIASPLQSLTLWDKTPTTPRSKFLPRFRAGLEAEAAVRKQAAEAATTTSSSASTTPPSTSSSSAGRTDWAQQAASADQTRKTRVERAAARAFDKAFAQAEAQTDNNNNNAMTLKPRSNKYQFVGVINPPSSQQPITWYARPKTADSAWSVRLVHVNRQAVLYDLFRRGKVDLLAKYKNQGKVVTEEGVPTRQPVVQAEYAVRERSWKNLWNFSPKHVFTDSSGMYWRERRLRPGLYTDGQTVYEASYRYTDGRNGMHRKSTLTQYLDSPKVPDKQKKRILQRLDTDTPDFVLEE